MLRIISDIIIKFSYISFLEMFKCGCFFQVDKAVGVDTLLFPCKETSSMVGINFLSFFFFFFSVFSEVAIVKKSLHIFFFKCVDPNLILLDCFSFITETALIFSELCGSRKYPYPPTEGHGNSKG